MQKAAAQQDAWARRSVLRCMAGKPGRDGWPGLDGGWGRAGPGGGGGRVYSYKKNVHMNRLECSFRAECQGENPVFFTRFFPGCSRFFPHLLYFSRRKNPVKIRGENLVLSRTSLKLSS